MGRFLAGIAFATSFIVGLPLVSTSAIASTVTYVFTNVTLSDSGVLNGTITTADYPGTGSDGISSWNLTTSGGAQPGQTYSSANSFNSIAIGPYNQPSGWDFFANAYNLELQLSFSGNLITGVGVSLLGGINGPSFECFDSWICPSGSAPDFAVRYVESEQRAGAFRETPLPSTWMMLIIGFFSFGLFARCGAKKQSAALMGA